MVNWFAVAGMVLTLLMLLFLRSRPNQKNVVPQRRVIKKSSMTEMQRLQIVCANPQTWWTGLYIIAIWTPVIIIALWGLPFLVARYQMDETTAAWGITLLWLGVAIGSPVIGWWSNRIHRRCMPLAVSAVFGFLSAVMVIYSDSLSWFWMCVMLFFFGIGTAGQALSFGVVRDINHTDTVGTAIGFNNMMAVIGSIFLQPIAGFILKMSWDGTMVAGAPVYSLGDYRLALLCIPISSLIALVVALFVLKETRCILQHAHTY
jgi:MFS family permease